MGIPSVESCTATVRPRSSPAAISKSGAALRYPTIDSLVQRWGGGGHFGASCALGFHPRHLAQQGEAGRDTLGEQPGLTLDAHRRAAGAARRIEHVCGFSEAALGAE